MNIVLNQLFVLHIFKGYRDHPSLNGASQNCYIRKLTYVFIWKSKRQIIHTHQTGKKNCCDAWRKIGVDKILLTISMSMSHCVEFNFCQTWWWSVKLRHDSWMSMTFKINCIVFHVSPLVWNHNISLSSLVHIHIIYHSIWTGRLKNKWNESDEYLQIWFFSTMQVA